VFHLLGYDHVGKAEEAVMLAKQEAVLDKLGLKRV
jgi:ssRNA-specific RNase YbeY (16S rRNA maturation enzyme)